MEQIERITGKSLFQQGQEEFLLLREQAQAGNVIALYNIGLCYLFGQKVTADFQEAYQWFEKAAQQGDKLAGLFMGYLNELGIGRNVNYSQAITYYKAFSPSIKEFDKKTLWEKAKKIDENEIERKLSEIYQQAIKKGEALLKIKSFCVYYPKDNSFNFKWNDNTRAEFKQPLEEYNKLVEEFKIFLDAYTSDSDDEKYGYWIYVFEDILNLTYEICNALVGRDTLYRYLEKVGLPAIEKNKNFEFALGRCLIDDNDDSDNDYIISGLLLIAGHDEDPVWQNKVGLWYEFRNENKDLLLAERWYKKAVNLDFSSAQDNIERLIGKKEYRLIADQTEGSSEDRLKVVKSLRGNEELRNKWLLSAATLGNENATEQLMTTIDINGNSIYNKACDFDPSWKKVELEQVGCNKKVDTWQKIVEDSRIKYLEEEKRRIRAEEEARRKAEEEARRKAEEEARRKAEEEERRRLAELEASSDDEPKSKKWIWILLGLLIAGAAGWYFLSGNNYGSEVTAPVEEVTDSEVEESDNEGSDDEEYESGPSTKLAFLEKFYQEGRLDEDYIKQRVTPLVLNRLRKAYGGDCKYGDCLGTWVFLAFPQGADAKIVDGPFISETSQPGIFKVDYVYSYYKDSSKSNETRTVYLTVIKSDNEFLISDFDIEEYNSEEKNQSDEVTSNGSITMAGKVSDYEIHMVLDVNGADVTGYYYYDSQGSGNRVTLKGSITEDVLTLYKYDADGNKTGYFEGSFNQTSYQGRNVNYSRDEALPFSVEILH